MAVETQHTPARALLVGPFHPGEENRRTSEEHLHELERLCDTYGVTAVGQELCPLRKVDVGTLLGSGKIEELILEADRLKADIVVFDHELTPSQQRNLEGLFKRSVMERTEIILGVFALHAHTKEAQLQVELAQINYQFPRLKRLWTHLARQRGGGSQVKGEGETQIELDRRMLRARKDHITHELKSVASHRELLRSRRSRVGIPSFAIVGYTNAGKSTLMNALTDAGVLAEDRLFATLDTTTRKYFLPNKQEILLIDTVGFIRKIPHTLVEAFHSTLEEALYADILLHIIDASHPNAVEQAETARAVLTELGAAKKPTITVLNKVDRLEHKEVLQRLRLAHPKSVPLSAVTREGFDQLLERMEGELSALRRTMKLRIPQSDYAVVSQLLRSGQVHYQEYEGNDICLKADVPIELISQLEKYAD